MILSDKPVRIDLTHEAGAWIEVVPPSVEQYVLAAKEHDDSASRGEILLALAKVCVVGWSYPDPVTPANIARLDNQSGAAVFRVLGEMVMGAPSANPTGGASMTPSKARRTRPRSG